MLIFVLMVSALLALIVLSSIPARFSGRSRIIAQIAADESKVVLQSFVVAGLIVSAIYVFVLVYIKSPNTRISSNMKVEEFLDKLEGWVNLFRISAWAAALIFFGLLIVFLFNLLERIGKLIGQRWSNRMLVTTGRAFGRYRRLITRFEIVAVVLGCVTFLGSQGGAIRDIAAAQIDLGKRGLAELSEAEGELVVLFASDSLVDVAWDEFPPRTRTTFDSLPPRIDDLSRRIAGAAAILGTDFFESKRRVTQLKAQVSRWVETARRTTSRSDNLAPVERRPAAQAENIDLSPDRQSLSLTEINRAKAEVETLKEEWRIQNGSGAAAELTRATVEATAEAILDPIRVEALRALGVDIPILQPVVDAIAGFVQGAIATRLVNERAPADVVRRAGGLKAWIVERAATWRGWLKAMKPALPKAHPAALAALETEIESVQRDLDEAQRRRRDELKRQNVEGLQHLRSELPRRLASVWDTKLRDLPPPGGDANLLQEFLRRRKTIDPFGEFSPDPLVPESELHRELNDHQRLLLDPRVRDLLETLRSNTPGAYSTERFGNTLRLGETRVSDFITDVIRKVEAIESPTDQHRAIKAIERASAGPNPELVIRSIAELSVAQSGLSVPEAVDVARLLGSRTVLEPFSSRSSPFGNRGYAPRPYRPVPRR